MAIGEEMVEREKGLGFHGRVEGEHATTDDVPERTELGLKPLYKKANHGLFNFRF